MPMIPVGIVERNTRKISLRPQPSAAALSPRKREDSMSRISLRRKNRTANRVPRCSRVSKASSGSRSPSSNCARKRWPELLTGRNSVAPWRIPRKIDWRRVTPRLPSCPGLRLSHRILHDGADPFHGGGVLPLETEHQDRLRVRGADQPPASIEGRTYAVHVDPLPCLRPDDGRYPLDDPEFPVVRAIHADLGRGDDRGQIGEQRAQRPVRTGQDLEEPGGCVDRVVVTKIPVREEDVAAHLPRYLGQLLLHLLLDERMPGLPHDRPAAVPGDVV